MPDGVDGELRQAIAEFGGDVATMTIAQNRVKATSNKAKRGDMNKLILGSQSRQRRVLLESIVGANAVTILPPSSDNEPGFEGLTKVAEIEQRLELVVRLKTKDVCGQVDDQGDSTVICADTVVVCKNADGANLVLGKPPMPEWQETVRRWFQDYYSAQTHAVWTGFQISSGPKSVFEIVKAEVDFPQIDEDWIDWYLSTEEPIGKAGGYGIQGHAAAFVSAIRGSLTTIIGLPQWEVRTVLREIGKLP